MLRLVTSLTLAATLCGCSVVPQDAWSYDPTRTQSKPTPDASQADGLAHRVAELQGELNAVRTQVATQPDAQHRLPLYAQEHRIGRELSPLQRELGQYAQSR